MPSFNDAVFLFLYETIGPGVFFSPITETLAVWFPFLVILSVPLIILFSDKEERPIHRIFAIFFPAFVTWLVVLAIKWFFPSPRPFVDLAISPLFSVSDPMGAFPSMHMAFFSALSIGMYAYHRKFGLLFLVSALLIGVARIGSGVHWPIDILGGMAIGFAIGLLPSSFNFMIVRITNGKHAALRSAPVPAKLPKAVVLVSPATRRPK